MVIKIPLRKVEISFDKPYLFTIFLNKSIPIVRCKCTVICGEYIT